MSIKAEKNRKAVAEWRDRLSVEDRKEYDRQRYRKYKDKYRSSSIRWAKNNPEKSTASSHQTTIRKKYPEAWKDTDIETPDLAQYIMDNKDTPCKYCGSDSKRINHRVPLAKGGSHTWNNIQFICKTCNIAKLDSTEEEFLLWIGKLIRHSREL